MKGDLQKLNRSEYADIEATHTPKRESLLKIPQEMHKDPMNMEL